MEPASIRYKNPGAMWGSPLAKKWGSTGTVKLNDGTGQGNNIAVFQTYVAGICAQLDLWRTSKNYKNKKFADAIRVWSGGNHVESYIKFVLARVPGMTRDTIMDDDFWRSPMGVQFLKAQAWHEAGKRYPALEVDWLEAQRIVMGGKPPKSGKIAPNPGTKPVVKSTEVWAGFGTILTTILSVVTDWRTIAVLCVVFALYMIYRRISKDDIAGWFRTPEPAPKKTRKRKK